MDDEISVRLLIANVDWTVVAPKSRLLIFGVDKTLVIPKSDNRFRHGADDWQWLPGRRERLTLLHSEGLQIGFASNQGGVAFGFLDPDAIANELYRMAAEIGVTDHNMVRMDFYHPDGTIPRYKGDSWRRKPKPGMLLDLMAYTGTSFKKTLMIGDMPEDEEAAKKAMTHFMWANEFFNLNVIEK